MDKKTKNLLIAGVASIGLGAAGYFVYNHLKKGQNQTVKVQNAESLTREKTIQILKQFKRDFFNVFSTLAMMSQQLKLQTRGKLSEQDIHEIIINHPKITEEVKQIEQKVYQKFEISEKTVKNATDVLYKDDLEIQALKKEMQEGFEKAAQGIPPDPETDIPNFLTAEKTLEIVKKIMMASTQKFQEVFQELIDQGEEINMNDPKVLHAFNNINITEVRAQILKEEGLEEFDEPGSKILQFATQKFSSENRDNFQEKMMGLELKHQKSMEAVMTNPKEQNLVEKIFNQEQQEDFGSSIFGGMAAFKRRSVITKNKTGSKSELNASEDKKEDKKEDKVEIKENQEEQKQEKQDIIQLSNESEKKENQEQNSQKQVENQEQQIETNTENQKEEAVQEEVQNQNNQENNQ